MLVLVTPSVKRLYRLLSRARVVGVTTKRAHRVQHCCTGALHSGRCCLHKQLPLPGRQPHPQPPRTARQPVTGAEELTRK
jgi:hypothetical protein